MDSITFAIDQRNHAEFTNAAIGKSMAEISAADVEILPFGPEYTGNFVLRCPNLGDRTRIDAVMKREFRKAGYTVFEDVSTFIHNQEYAFAAVEVLSSEKPEWFDREKLSTNTDQLAVIEVGAVLNEHVESKKKKPSGI